MTTTVFSTFDSQDSHFFPLLSGDALIVAPTGALIWTDNSEIYSLSTASSNMISVYGTIDVNALRLGANGIMLIGNTGSVTTHLALTLGENATGHARLANAGLIMSTGLYAIWDLHGGNIINNAGRIMATQHGAILGYDHSSNDQLINTGTISAIGSGVVMSGNYEIVNNSGSISAITGIEVNGEFNGTTNVDATMSVVNSVTAFRNFVNSKTWIVQCSLNRTCVSGSSSW